MGVASSSNGLSKIDDAVKCRGDVREVLCREGCSQTESPFTGTLGPCLFLYTTHKSPAVIHELCLGRIPAKISPQALYLHFHPAAKEQSHFVPRKAMAGLPENVAPEHRTAASGLVEEAWGKPSPIVCWTLELQGTCMV